jgi:hypothetical protein
MPARLVPLAVGTAAGAVSGLAESGLVHRLTRGRMWIGLLTTLLVGIVALNVFTLSVNATSSRTTRQTDVLQRQNSALQGQIAAAGASSDRVQTLAGKLGMIVPELGSIGYVEAGPKDAALAAQRLESGAITASATTTTDTTTPTATTTVPTTTPTTPTATTPTTPVATPTTTPPTATVTPTTTIDPASGTATGTVSTP